MAIEVKEEHESLIMDGTEGNSDKSVNLRPLSASKVKEDRQSLTMNSDDDEMASHVWHTGNDLSVAYTPKSVSEVSILTDSQTLDSIPSRSKSIDRSQTFGVDENKDRGNWTGRMDFLLSMLGYAVGLGNIWRFPYLCYRNGGGAFLIPYLIFMAIVGIPLFFMESALAQFTSCGPTTCWEFAPLFQGVGFAMIMCSGLTSIYYNMIIAWCHFFLFASFQSPLPWSGCDNDWNSKDCRLKLPSTECLDATKFVNGTCYTNGQFLGLWNETLFTEMTGRKRILPSEEYWNNHVLGISDGVDNLGPARWQLVLVLLLAWVECFLCLIKGIKTTGKVVYFTAIFPYVVLLILFIRGVTLENAGEGIKFYIIPDFKKLGDAKVWRDAAVQIFYSMGPGWGGLIALASYNRFHNNVLRDSLIVSLGYCMTSIFGGFVIFSYLGYMAGQLQTEVGKVATHGAGLVFVIYPEAMNQLPGSAFWSVIFFFMLITLGLDSQFAMVETVLTGICDSFPDVRKYKTYIILAICIVAFLLGLPMTTEGGVYVLQIMDHYVAAWSLLMIGLCEVLAVTHAYGLSKLWSSHLLKLVLQIMDHYVAAWSLLMIGLCEVLAVTHAYGWRRFCQDIELMIGSPPWIFWKVTWLVTCPIGIVFILLFAWIDYTPVKYGDYNYPGWADAIGWLLALASVICIPAMMIRKLYKEDESNTIIGKLRLLLLPSRIWGPALVKHRELVDYVHGFVTDPTTEDKYLNKSYSWSTITSNQKTGSQWSVPVDTQSQITQGSNATIASKITYESNI